MPVDTLSHCTEVFNGLLDKRSELAAMADIA
jgi:hypothetical protein